MHVHESCEAFAPATCLQEVVEPLGRVNLAIWMEEVSESLFMVHLDLIAAENVQRGDVYAKVKLNPDPQNLQKRKSKVVFKTRNPVFNESFSFNWCGDSLAFFCRFA